MSFSLEISVSDLLSPEAIILNITEPKKNHLLHFLCTRMSKVYPDINQQQFFRDIMQRENDLSTGIGNHIAIPHAIAENAQKLHLFLATHTGIEYDSLDGKPVQIIFMLVIPSAEKQLYSIFLIKLSQMMRNREFNRLLMRTENPEEIITLFKQHEEVS